MLPRAKNKLGNCLSDQSGETRKKEIAFCKLNINMKDYPDADILHIVSLRKLEKKHHLPTTE